MKPYMKENEINLFKKYLNFSNKFLEYGSGGSTIYAINNKIKNIVSIETDKKWYDKINNHPDIINKNNIKIINIDLGIDEWWKYVSWCGNKLDIKEVFNDNMIKYQNIYNEIEFNPDLILIDGRFRVICTLNLYNMIDENTFIMIHDYHRTQYHVIEQFYQKIEQTNTLCILKKKDNINSDLLEKYKEDYKYIID